MPASLVTMRIGLRVYVRERSVFMVLSGFEGIGGHVTESRRGSFKVKKEL
ncbi:hypothetical protein SPHINGO8AM_80266 [Sphingomonas sp. 8AM]|nr:hypothetical protein SPHINGO8AM_80266 [Sphingomonas sp. 8AM]